MAKSPLFARLRQTLWLAADASDRRLSAREALERRAESAFSRRQALQALGVTSGAMAMTALGVGCASETTPESETSTEAVSGVARSEVRAARVVVVGAGLAGLTAAYRLSQRGFAPSVFDAGKRVGGRTSTLRRGFPTKVELGGELIDTGHTELRTLAGELGLTVLDQAGAVSAFDPERYFLNGAVYTEQQVLEDFVPLAKILRRDWRAQGSTFTTFEHPTPTAQLLDRLSLADWLDKHGVSGALRSLLDTAYTSEYGRDIGEQSYLNLLYLIGRKPPPFQIFGESDEKYTILEGNDAVATRMAERLSQEVTLEHSLVAVRARADGTLDVVFDHRGRTVHVLADKLVLALPFTQLRKCELSSLSLTPEKKLSIASMPYGTNTKLMVATNSRPWQTEGATGTSFTDAAYNESWDTSRGFATAGGVMTSFTGGKRGLSVGSGGLSARAEEFVRQLDKVFPGTQAAFTGVATRMSWATATHFEGSYACFAPGNWTTFVGSELVIEGNVHFAGEHTSLDYQGFMNGAVQSGERVAKEVRKALRDTASG